ncbi:glycosyltransferase family 2 protein [Sporosarcina sp. FSL K6-1508]|uniref:glycosyltransferase family 2 protein n=1 Tax=Sporosarcina sp. FSL K6-1508 TaxID=2921553 RepID=UPI0030F85C59
MPNLKKHGLLDESRGGERRTDSNDQRDSNEVNQLRKLGLRYACDFDVLVIAKGLKKRQGTKVKSIDISSTGLLVEFNPTANLFNVGDTVELRFEIPPGTMPEGMESSVKIEAIVDRECQHQHDGQEMWVVAFTFVKPLTDYLQKKRWGYTTLIASTLLLMAILFIILMRVESVIYFKYNKVLYLYSLLAASFLLTRYLFGAFYRNVKINPDYTPGVSIIIPCFNEEEWIQRTIISCMNQDYPIDKLEVIVVDDQSTDRTVEQIYKAVEGLNKEAEHYLTKDRLHVHVLKENGGKRVALVQGVEMAQHDLVVFVDSDSFLEPNAIINLVQPFQDPKMGGVAGRTDVENKYTNFITKLQTVRYYIAFRVMKAAESYFDCVTCLSGPLSCYRKELIVKHTDAWLNQKFLGQPATFGDDRSMTNYILKTHRTGYQDKAVCSTIVPSRIGVFLKQQMRWKRSWLRESLRAGTFIWRKELFMAFFFYIGLIVPIAAPIIVLYNMLYVPIVYGVIPTTFMMGLLLMALLMSLSYLFFRKSKLWVFGFVFCAFYELVLLWQMPIAWVTFWKSTWGTRDTPQDVEARNKKLVKKQKKNSIALNSRQ